MEFASATLSSILSKAAEYLVEPILRQGHYLFCFKSIVEDLKEEYENLRLVQENVQQQVDRATRNAEEIKREVQDWLMKASTVVADVQSLEEEINANKSRLNVWCFNLGRKYKLSRRVAKQTSILLELQYVVKFSNISYPGILPRLEFLVPNDFMTFESTKFAFNRIMEALKDDETSIVGLYGMGGVGKTTLARVVGNATREDKLFDEVIMVVVSQAVNIISIQDQIADSLSLKLEENHELGRARQLFLRLKSENKILLILDDVWKELDLSTIGIPFGNEYIGCKILITTRVERVCIAMKCQKKVALNVLNQKEGIDLFKKHVRIGDDSTMLSEATKRIVKECGGLPIAIITIGKSLRDKSIEEWEVVYEELKKSKLDHVESFGAHIFASIKLSYDYLERGETKFCFLLCSLFPDDHEIDLEILLRFGLGLDLFRDADSIGDARSQLQVTIEKLKASSLLSSDRKGFVKMHSVVRDVALRIASMGENVFMVKAGIRLAKWPQHKDIEQYTAISLMRSKIEVFPNQLVCPKLKILLLDGDDDDVSNEFFEAMKALKVASLELFHLSLNSLKSLTNLVTLRLINCKLRDMPSLKMLAKLEILILHDCELVEVLEELRELNKLRLLDIRRCFPLERIPGNAIPSLSRLEELYIDGSFKVWEVEGTSAEISNVSLSELSKLYCLTVVSLSIKVHKCLPKDVVWLKKLRMYDIRVNYEDSSESHPNSRSLAIRDIEGTSLFAFKPLYKNVEYLELYNIKGCCQNIIPSIDETGLNELKRLSLRHFQEVECIIDMMQQHVTIYGCDKLQDVFQPEGICYTKKNPSLLSSLVSLDLSNLPNLKYIWKGPTQKASLQSLTVVEVARCEKLRYIFTLNLARSLLQLQQLKVRNCDNLEHIVEIKAEETEDNIVARDGNDVVLPKLRILEVVQARLINFCSENYNPTLPALQELKLQSTPSLVAELGAKLQAVKETLRVLEVEESDEFCKVALAQLKNNFQNLECLKIGHCSGVQEIFQLEQQFSHSSLRELKLYALEDLECLHKGSARLLSLPNLRQLEVSDCKRLGHFLSSTLARNLPQLKAIDIRDCGELEQLMVEDDREDHVQLPLFPNLSSIYVSGCEKLKTLFPMTTARLGLQQLISLEVTQSPQLEEIFGHEDEADMIVETEIVLPQLRSLNLAGLESFVNFCPSGYHFVFPSLSRCRVQQCPKLTTRFSEQSGLADAQTKAFQTEGKEEMIIDHLRGVKVIFPLKRRLSLSSLKVLKLYDLEDLEHLYEGPAHLLSMPNLQHLEVSHCKRLRHLLSSTLAQNLPQLKAIDVRDCGELEQLMVENDRQDHVQLGPFPSLSSIYVSGCEKLKTLFPVTIARLGLEHLTSLEVTKSPQLEEIFGHEDEADMTGDTELVLPQLQRLTLERLESLTNLCPPGYHLIFPSLLRLWVQECPKITTRISVEQNGSVHAQGELILQAPLTDNSVFVLCFN